MIVYYSLGNRKYWFTTVERLIEIAGLLAKKSYLLCDIEPINRIYNDWIILNENYVRRLSRIIEEISEEIDDEKLLTDLLAFKEVLDGGDVVFG